MIFGEFPVERSKKYQHYTLKADVLKYGYTSIYDFNRDVAKWAVENGIDVEWTGFWTETVDINERFYERFYTLSFNSNNPEYATMLCLRWS